MEYITTMVIYVKSKYNFIPKICFEKIHKEYGKTCFYSFNENVWRS